MKHMIIGKDVEFHFWGNVEYPTNEAARTARDYAAKQLRSAGVKVKCSVLSNQTRKYAGLGQPDGSSGNVYICRAPYAPEILTEVYEG